MKVRLSHLKKGDTVYLYVLNGGIVKSEFPTTVDYVEIMHNGKFGVRLSDMKNQRCKTYSFLDGDTLFETEPKMKTRYLSEGEKSELLRGGIKKAIAEFNKDEHYRGMRELEKVLGETK